MTDRAGAVMFKATPMTLVGPELKAGDMAPDFQCVDNTLTPVALKDTEGSVRIFSVVPSLDTPVCDAQTRRFNEVAAGLDSVDIYTVSVDLPFAQKRYCNTFGIDRVKMLSDYRDASFGAAYGTLIKELRIECRALFVVDRDGVVRHSEYVRETSTHPNYDAALSVARSLANAAQAV
ncbi:MAG TPA: thiol peroxidase [Bryobacteraceae bacterium]|nr:thiol peroxidase [Bryobacteraceae bacterium]